MRDDEHRIHPDLIPYDELSEQSREYDRVAARGIIVSAFTMISKTTSYSARSTPSTATIS